MQLSATLFNRRRDGLGLPLPGEALRVYEPDASGALRYTGAATVPNMPVDQKVSVGLAQAFDVFTERRVVRSQRLGKHVVRRSVEVVVTNERAAPIDVRLVQQIEGFQRIVSESHPHAALADRRVQWTVRVPAGGEATLRFTADMRD